MNDLMVKISNVSRNYGPVRAVRDLDLSLRRGGIMALLGPSGCGKTTTLRLLAGFETPESGEIEIGGRSVAGPGVNVPPEKRGVGMVFQDYALFPHLTVRGNVAYGLKNGKRRSGRIEEVLALAHLDNLGNRMPHELSGGQQQRVALARALAPGPDVVLLDEPFSNLDAELRAAVREEVREILRRAGATAVLVTHDQEEALSLADRVAILWQGRLVQVATPNELYRQPATVEVAAFIGDADLLPGEATGGFVGCELGRLPVCPPTHGQVRVLIRPEAVQLCADPNGSAQVVAREFYGHDQVVVVRLPSGRLLRARLGPWATFQPGDCVEVGIDGAVSVFPNDVAPTAT